MGMTADNDIGNDSDERKCKDVVENSSLHVRCYKVQDEDMDHRDLVIDCMFHRFNNCCLGQKDPDKKCRTCIFGHGTESSLNNYNTPGK